MTRKYRTQEEKQAILNEFGSGITVKEIAKKHGISQGRFYAWKRRGVTKKLKKTPALFQTIELALPPAAPSLIVLMGQAKDVHHALGLLSQIASRS